MTKIARLVTPVGVRNGVCQLSNGTSRLCTLDLGLGQTFVLGSGAPMPDPTVGWPHGLATEPD